VGLCVLYHDVLNAHTNEKQFIKAEESLSSVLSVSRPKQADKTFTRQEELQIIYTLLQKNTHERGSVL